MFCTSSMYILFRWTGQGLRPFLNWTATAPFGGSCRRGEEKTLLRRETFLGFTGVFSTLRRPSSTFEFSGQKTRKYRKVWRVDLWTFFIRSSEKNSCSSFHNRKKIRMRFFFRRKKKNFFGFENFFRKKSKKSEKNRKNRLFPKTPHDANFAWVVPFFCEKVGPWASIWGGGLPPFFGVY